MTKVILIEGINGGGGDVVYPENFKGVYPAPEGDLHINGPERKIGAKLTVRGSPNEPLIKTNLGESPCFVRPIRGREIEYRVSLIDKEEK